MDYGWLSYLAFLIVGGAAGMLAYARWLVWQGRKRHYPKNCPLEARTLLAAEECEVWHWLRRAFEDHHVMVKPALSRFTCPRKRKHAAAALAMLNKLYCTFVVTTADGTVLGCLDVPGEAGLPRKHREFKETILTGCGIPYAVVHGGNLPSREALRAVFLGEPDIADAEDAQPAPDEFAQELATFSRSFQQKKLPSPPMPVQSALKRPTTPGLIPC